MLLLIKNTASNHPKFMELIRFGMVGILSTAITYGIYYLLMHCINVSIAYTIAYIVAFFVNFILTTYFTFKVKPTKRNGFGFIVSNIINYALSVGLLNLFIHIGVSKAIAPIPMFAVTIPTNFLIVSWLMKK